MNSAKIEIKGKKPFTIWVEDGSVKQSGDMSLPEILAQYPNSQHGEKCAQAFISGFKAMADLSNL